MSVVDSMPRKWRALVYVFGFQKVYALYVGASGEDDAMQAWHQLESLRQRP